MHISNCPKSLIKILGEGPVRLALGNFDGVHVGHQKLIQSLVQRARAAQQKSVVVTFLPHPAQFFARNTDFKKIDTPAMRRRRLSGLGLDGLLELNFDESLSGLSGEEFLQKYLEPLNIREVSVGRDFKFGKNRSGDVALLQRHGQVHGFEVNFIEHVSVGDEVASSSLIREKIAKLGDAANAAKLLGRPFELEGVVVRGDQIGRTIGFPTANIDAQDQILPKFGVYAGYLHVLSDLSGELRGVDRMPCVVNVGVRPTVAAAAPSVRIEAHILGQTIDLYGEHVRLQFVSRIRDEKRFETLDQLKTQIALDIHMAERSFNI